MKQQNATGAVDAPNDPVRRQLLSDEPSAVGASWAVDACDAALQSGRRIEGGWPGTVPEARMRVLGVLSRELTVRGMAPLSHAELVTATATTYERAKREWGLASKVRRAKPSTMPGSQ